MLKIKNPPDIINFDVQYYHRSETMDCMETIMISRHTGHIRISRTINDMEMTTSLYDPEGISDLLGLLNSSNFSDELKYYSRHCNSDMNSRWDYMLNVRMSNGKKYTIFADYDQEELLPMWPEMMKAIHYFLNDHSYFELFDPSLFKNRIIKKDYLRFAFVKFNDFGREYTYLCDIEDICEGDLVRVPVGNYGKTTTAEIVRIEYHTEDDAPYPLNRIKKVIKIIEESDFDEMREEDIIRDERNHLKTPFGKIAVLLDGKPIEYKATKILCDDTIGSEFPERYSITIPYFSDGSGHEIYCRLIPGISDITTVIESDEKYKTLSFNSDEYQMIIGMQNENSSSDVIMNGDYGVRYENHGIKCILSGDSHAGKYVFGIAWTENSHEEYAVSWKNSDPLFFLDDE